MMRQPMDGLRQEAPTFAYLRSLLGSRYTLWLARAVAALACFAIALVLTVAPGPAFVFWILGFVLLGVSVGQLLLTVHAVQDWLHRHVPAAQRLPRLRKGHIRTVLRHRWVRALERLSEPRERRRRARERRRAAWKRRLHVRRSRPRIPPPRDPSSGDR